MRRLHEERGVALPVTISVLFMVAGLATVTARAAITSEHQSLRDRNVKAALAAANAGLEAALYRTNLMQPGSTQCAYNNPGNSTFQVGAVESDGWCREQSEDLGNGAGFTMRVSGAQWLHANGQTLSRRSIVSTGTANGVRRRLMLQVNAATGEPVFPNGYGGVSLDGLTLPNTVQVDGGVGSNGNIYLRNSAQVCGKVTAGPGKTVEVRNSAVICSGSDTTPATESFNLQPVDQGNAPTDNDNFRIGNPPATDSQDPCTDCSGIDWDPATRILRLRNNSTLTLGGGLYSFCGIEIENTAQLKVAVRPLGTGIRLFIDSPEQLRRSRHGVRDGPQLREHPQPEHRPDDLPADGRGQPDDRHAGRVRGHRLPAGPRDGRVRALLDDPHPRPRPPDRCDRVEGDRPPEQRADHLSRAHRRHHHRQPPAPVQARALHRMHGDADRGRAGLGVLNLETQHPSSLLRVKPVMWNDSQYDQGHGR